ncbi:zinc finger protein 585A-like isoform X2 [Dermacentor silvarum]|uniref:zinc finger protein 585A-like isoform X2 n=1 Tax=Dermacentor silvarum TaxID=543639 RepID=UPI0021008F46|nr:zinc finger protein 585A-like isoform X2 [Dermacentor silvarum]
MPAAVAQASPLPQLPVQFSLHLDIQRLPVIVSSRSLSLEVVDDVLGSPFSAPASSLPNETEPANMAEVVSGETPIETVDVLSGEVAGTELVGRRTASCQYCPYVAKDRSNLAFHLRTHSNERPFLCEVCGRGFKRKEHVEYHRRIHTGEKRYKCSVCSYACVQKQSLKSHMRLHTGEKPFQCAHCSKAFTYRKQLHRHTIQHKDLA